MSADEKQKQLEKDYAPKHPIPWLTGTEDTNTAIRRYHLANNTE